MPSRRDLLATGLALGSSTVVGCLDRSTTWDGFVQLKALRGIRDDEPEVDVVRVQVSGEDDVDTRVSEDHEEFFEDPRRPTVDSESHRQLQQEFSSGLRYVIGICRKDTDERNDLSCRNTRADRESFNRVQVFDLVEAELAEDTFEVLDAETPSEQRIPDWA